jgi:hypothetical protein
MRKYMMKFGAVFLAAMMVMSSTTMVGFRDVTRDVTYVYEGVMYDMPIPDAYQYRTSVFLRSMVDNVQVLNPQGVLTRSQVTRPFYMYITPETYGPDKANWIYIVEMELNGVIVIDGDMNLVTHANQPLMICSSEAQPRHTNNQFISEFTLTRSLFESTFANIRPGTNEVRDMDLIMNLRNAIHGWQCICACTCPPTYEIWEEEQAVSRSSFTGDRHATVPYSFSRGSVEGGLVTEIIVGRPSTVRLDIEFAASDLIALFGEPEEEEEEEEDVGEEEPEATPHPFRFEFEIADATHGMTYRHDILIGGEVEGAIVVEVENVEISATVRERRYRITLESEGIGEWNASFVRASVEEHVKVTEYTPYYCGGEGGVRPDGYVRCAYIVCVFQCERSQADREYGWCCQNGCVHECSALTIEERRLGVECLCSLNHTCCTFETCGPIPMVCKLIDEDAVFTTGLRRPEGIFVDANGLMYIADTQHNRVLVVEEKRTVNGEGVSVNDGWEIIMLIYMPSARELGGERLTSFLPTSVVADSAGRISVVARNINNGILQFSKAGTFNRFIGAPSVNMSPWERFWRRFQTERQRAQRQSHVPTEYNNIRIDDRNFIWGTISAISSQEMRAAVASPTSSTTTIKKLNPLGGDILKRRGSRGIWGDLDMFAGEEPSRIIDVGIGPAGIYTMLDARRGRMFTFNDEGIMLFAFGNIGTRKGNFRQPASIGYMGMNIMVLDTELAEIVMFEPTLYGELIIMAEYHFMAGEYQLAYDAWAQAAEQNANFSHAFYGLGNARFLEGDYTQAMAYFEHSGSRDGYSRSRDMLRQQQMETMFPYLSMAVIIGALALVGWLIYKGVRNYALSDDIIGYDRDADDQ